MYIMGIDTRAGYGLPIYQPAAGDLDYNVDHTETVLVASLEPPVIANMPATRADKHPTGVKLDLELLCTRDPGGNISDAEVWLGFWASRDAANPEA